MFDEVCQKRVECRALNIPEELGQVRHFTFDQFKGVNTKYIKVNVCVYAIEIQTTPPISMKFGMGILLNTGKVRNWDLTPTPGVRGTLNRVWHAFDLVKTL
jgi:hypothetical protein